MGNDFPVSNWVELVGEEQLSTSPSQLLSRFIDAQPVRIAVDPKAMAADCTVRGAHVALEAGETLTARDLFRSVVGRYAEPEYAYDTDQAGRGLTDLYYRGIDRNSLQSLAELPAPLH